MSDFNFFLNRQGPRGAQGVKGDTGFSPTIAPSADNDGLTVYKLVITNENNTYETDNLMGNLNIVDDGGTYLRYDREIGSVRAAEADTATANGAGVIRLSNSTDYENLAADTAMTPSSFVDNYNSIFTEGYGIEISQNYNDKITIGLTSDIVNTTDLQSALTEYVKYTSLTGILSDYVTNSSLSTTLSSYATKQWAQSNTDILYSAMQNWVRNQNYVNTSDLSTTLENYVQNSVLNNYVTNSSLSNTLQNYVDINNEQTVSATKTFTADQKINGIRVGQKRVSSVNDNLVLQSYTDEYGDPTTNSTILYLGSGGVSVDDGAGHSYRLMNTSNGFILDDRLSSNIARTSDVTAILGDIETALNTINSGV